MLSGRAFSRPSGAISWMAWGTLDAPVACEEPLSEPVLWRVLGRLSSTDLGALSWTAPGTGEFNVSKDSMETKAKRGELTLGLVGAGDGVVCVGSRHLDCGLVEFVGLV